MKIIKIIQNGKSLKFTSKGNAHFIQLIKKQIPGKLESLKIYFKGIPKIAKNPPWDGGFTWQKDKNKNHFIANSNQGIGASIWWPCKDHPYDEPDKGVNISVTTPKNLMDVSNGRFIGAIDNKNGTKTYQWQVVNPINSYAINTNIADYIHFSEVYKGEKGNLDCNYYVLSYNLDKAKIQFKQVSKMLEAFEHWFGPYPFYEDGYKLVEVPYLGMEHQSSVTYGNHFKNGYLGGDLSNTGWGLKFDFIIIHESGHEWFANSITNKDVADMWIHEGFTTYSEVLYLDYHFGKKAGNDYVIGIRNNISNDKPIIGSYNVDNNGSDDMYPKAANMIHMIRQIVDDDEKFRGILREMNRIYYHKNVSSSEIENFLNQRIKPDLTAFFDQYLRTIKIPVLEYKIKGNSIKFRFKNVVKGFKIPVKVYINGTEEWIKPGEYWQSISSNDHILSFKIDPNFYIKSSKSK
jgi:aminopeptidase N